TGLAYHYPIKTNRYTMEDAKKYDIASSKDAEIIGLTKETIKEAAMVGHALGLDRVIVDAHLFGFVDSNPTEKARGEYLRTGEANLLGLKKFADDCSATYGCKVALTRENNPPDHGLLLGTLDFAPQDVVRTANKGIGVCLDFAHIGQLVNYYKRGKGELPGADMSRNLYGDVTVRGAVEITGEHLALVHINDAYGYMMEGEGVEVGFGNFPHKTAIPLICRKAGSVIGTYEIKYGHTDPDAMLRCDRKYRKLFGKDFERYFE
ncbi:MAG: hypothetical protein QXD77_03035, partial [Candidatus Aenigmatarchaeota archaeon]